MPPTAAREKKELGTPQTPPGAAAPGPRSALLAKIPYEGGECLRLFQVYGVTGSGYDMQL